MSHNQPVPGFRHADLLRAVEALRNEKALFVLLATGLLVGASVFLMYSLSGPGAFTSIVMFVSVFLLLPAGMSTAGLLLMDQARGLMPRPLDRALPDGLFAALRLIAVFLAGVAVIVVFFVFLSLLLFICKAPFLGPVLYAVLFPIFTVMAGLLCLGLVAAQSMAGPAIWDGATVRKTLSILVRLAARRGVELLISLLLLAMLVVLAEFVIFGIVVTGYKIVLGASASILGSSSLGMMDIPVFSSAQSIASNGYAQAFAFGSMIILVLILTAIMAVTLMGLNLIYLRITGDLPMAATNSPNTPPSPPNYGKARKAAVQPPEARAADTAARPAANAVPDILAGLFAETSPPAAATPSVCPHCRAAIQPGDRFCGECGKKIQD
ncbi:MAG: zinc ribbon domain-containing protein [Azoarcus sp.]|nr:zinc ribbon domain-containing protein [Azoarcus sp.]